MTHQNNMPTTLQSWQEGEMVKFMDEVIKYTGWLPVHKEIAKQFIASHDQRLLEMVSGMLDEIHLKPWNIKNSTTVQDMRRAVISEIRQLLESLKG